MRIRLLVDVPVGAEHGLTKGRILPVIRWDGSWIRDIPHWWVKSDAGEEIGILAREAEIVSESEGEDAEIPEAAR